MREVRLIFFCHLFGGSDQVPCAPRLDRLPDERAGAGVQHLLLGLAMKTSGEIVLRIRLVAADVPAVLGQYVGLVLPLVRLASEVRGVGMLRDDAQGQLLAAAADQDLRMRLLARASDRTGLPRA